MQSKLVQKVIVACYLMACPVFVHAQVIDGHPGDFGRPITGPVPDGMIPSGLGWLISLLGYAGTHLDCDFMSGWADSMPKEAIDFMFKTLRESVNARCDELDWGFIHHFMMDGMSCTYEYQEDWSGNAAVLPQRPDPSKPPSSWFPDFCKLTLEWSMLEKGLQKMTVKPKQAFFNARNLCKQNVLDHLICTYNGHVLLDSVGPAL